MRERASENGIRSRFNVYFVHDKIDGTLLLFIEVTEIELKLTEHLPDGRADLIFIIPN